MNFRKKGTSLIETIVGVGLLSGVILGYLSVQKFSGIQNKMTDQNTIITRYIIEQKKNLSRSDTCNSMVSIETDGSLKIDWGSYDFGSSGLSKTDNDLMVLPTPPDDNGHILPINVLIEFERDTSGKRSKAKRKLTFFGMFKDQKFVKCVDYETISIASLIRVACENLGAKFDSSNIGDPKCDFSELTKDDRFADNILKEVCENIYQGEYNDGVCNKLVISPGAVEGSNIKQDKVQLRQANWREKFDQLCPNQPNMFLKGFSASGEPKCLQYRFCPDPSDDSSCGNSGVGGGGCNFAGEVDNYIENTLKSKVIISYDPGSPATFGQPAGKYKVPADLRMNIRDELPISHRCYFGFKTSPEVPSQLTEGFFGKTQNYPTGIKWISYDALTGNTDTSYQESGNPDPLVDKIFLSTQPFGSLAMDEMTGGVKCSFNASDLYSIICPDGTENPEPDMREFEKYLPTLTNNTNPDNGNNDNSGSCTLTSRQWFGSDDGPGLGIICSAPAPSQQTLTNGQSYTYTDEESSNGKLIVRCDNGSPTIISKSCPFVMRWKYNGSQACTTVTNSAYPYLTTCAGNQPCFGAPNGPDKCRNNQCSDNSGITNTFQCKAFKVL